ncbi:MAG: hypothetical protein EON55_11305 [Alphaproteobacteria bacterium]|nr:MAG: hypothetical protein EON55_11305 [Alphaproteobacteria bacterium]
MHTTIPRLATTAFTVAMIGLMTACTQGEPGHVNPASIGDGSSLTRSDQRALKPAPTPALGTVGAQSAPSFGPGVGAEINTGIGVQRFNGLVP